MLLFLHLNVVFWFGIVWFGLVRVGLGLVWVLSTAGCFNSTEILIFGECNSSGWFALRALIYIYTLIYIYIYI